MSRPVITSFQNSKIKLANKLVSKRQREKDHLFIIDYARDLDRALAADYAVEFGFYCEALASEDDRRLVTELPEDLVHDVPVELMQKASYRQNPGGLVAIMRQKPVPGLTELMAAKPQMTLMLVDLRKPGNIGALLRTADATGMDAVVIVDSALDIYNPNIIRASTGAVFVDHLYLLSSEEAFGFLEQENILSLAAHLHGTKSLFEVNFNEQPTAIVLGTEDTGLNDTWAHSTRELVKIPMVGQIADSLNVSVSGAIFMYEALRQRMA